MARCPKCGSHCFENAVRNGIVTPLCGCDGGTAPISPPASRWQVDSIADILLRIEKKLELIEKKLDKMMQQLNKWDGGLMG